MRECLNLGQNSEVDNYFDEFLLLFNYHRKQY